MVAPVEIDRMVAEALERHTKDKEVIETGLAMKAAEMLIGWTKIFGWFVAVPATLLLAVLGWFGISTVKDAREKLEQATATLGEARSAALQADTALQQAKSQLAATSQNSAAIDTQLERLREFVRQNEQRINALDNTVKEILKFAPGAKLSDPIKIQISQFLGEFRQYFERLGYQPGALERSEINVRTDDPQGILERGSAIAFYDPSTSTMFISSDYAESEYPILRQYAHRVLYASTTITDFSQAPQSLVSSWQGLEYGLADYFPASFRNRSRLEAISTRKNGAHPGFVIVDLNEDASFQAVAGSQLGRTMLAQKAWRGALWEIREKLGKETADMCVYRAWCELKPVGASGVDDDFVKLLLAHVHEAAAAPGEQAAREILLRRGYDPEFLKVGPGVSA